MDPKTPSNSEIINNVRNLTISRRGGVGTRGGKLSPINVRDLTASNKKVVAPNIPQRRRIIKTENGSSEQLVVKSEKPTSFENTRGRGRGRQQRVFLQTEGSFLAEGPAARLKRDPASDGSISVPRVTRRSAKAGPDKNIDADAIRDLMDSYVAGEEYENVNEGKPPLRLPVQKDKVTCKIKLESDEDDKTKIKKEIIEDDKTKIKKEIIEDFETGVKKEIKTEKDEDLAIAENVIKEETEYEKPTADSFLNIKDDGTLILLQLPVLSCSLKATDYEKDKAAKENDKEKDKKPAKDNEPKAAPKFIDNFEEGFLGKLKIMKSGRMKLTLGSVEFELLDGTPSETYQEAASVKVGDGEGDITVLGKVEKKLILSPVISKLLTEHVRSSKSLNFEE